MNDIQAMMQQLGVSPDRITPEKFAELMKLADTVQDPANITPEITKKIVDILGGYHANRHKTDKVGRNESCPCNSGKKYKKCCY